MQFISVYNERTDTSGCVDADEWQDLSAFTLDFWDEIHEVWYPERRDNLVLLRMVEY